MTDFPLHTAESAPKEAQANLQAAEKKMGFLPNIFAKMAEAPTLLEAYLTLDGIYAKTSLSPVEQQAALLAISADNHCEFCVAAHTGGIKKAGADDEIIKDLRARNTPNDAKLAAMTRFARHLNAQRGWAEKTELDAFLEAGFTQQQVLELVIACALKTLSNYTNHVAGTPLNEELKPLAWEAPAS
ncbi:MULTISPECIES: carboxymuconolactone decarboxylase family protein [Halomonadaceae]|uniref:Carboxymuconolactone decarboxylase family protein n=2 Tax=Vreelandella TaxID=3137766 RepID=A0A7Z0LTB8_9GAMM|nr:MULTISPECIES: carboxymuconolactone decarboxylase family protein [Halomonas]AJY49711.1 alkylhydroperoxidase like protein, AhpD family [Halomonas sp. KO116]NYS78162.1 carboxymuconolactone decarboxylase family protein [Halomonas glaciei]